MSRHPTRRLLHSLSDLWAGRADLWIYCCAEPTDCYRSHKVDLIAMILKYGDLEVAKLRGRLKCDVCGSKAIDIKMSATDGVSQLPRELPPEAKKKIAADAIGRGMSGVANARAEIRAGKPMRL